MKRCILLPLILLFTASCSEWFDPGQAAFCGSEPEIGSPTAIAMPDGMSFYNPQVELDLKLEKYGSCADLEDQLIPQLQSAYQKASSYRQQFAGGSTCAFEGIAQIPETLAGTTDGGVTNRQEAQVDEGDIVKVSDHQIYVAKPDFIEVLDRASLEVQFSLDTKELRNVSLLFYGDILVALGNLADDYRSSKRLRFYQTRQNTEPVMIREMTLQGNLHGVRLHGGSLSLVLSKNLYTIWNEEDSETIRASVRQSLSGIDCTAIYKPLVKDADANLTTVYQFQLDQPGIPQKNQSIVGNYANVYMSSDSLYMTKSGFSTEQEVSPGHFQTQSTNAVVKVDISSDWGVFESVGEFSGSTIGSWAFKEIQGALAVATTSRNTSTYTKSSNGRYGTTIDQTPMANHLYILKTIPGTRQLAPISSVRGFGETENIRSVRYLGDKAYVVTFRQTDPLFVIDLQDIESPEILSELKAPGFSKYLHPALNNKLIGVGYAANDNGRFAEIKGVQLSLFDIENDFEPKTIQQLELGDSGSFTEVLLNHQAFYHNPQTNIVGFPLVRVQHNNSQPGESPTRQFSGAQFFRASDEGFTTLGQISHQPWIDKNCNFEHPESYWWATPQSSLDVNRIFQLDDRLMVLSRFGISSHAIDDPSAPLKAVEFSKSQRDCGEQDQPVWIGI